MILVFYHKLFSIRAKADDNPIQRPPVGDHDGEKDSAVRGHFLSAAEVIVALDAGHKGLVPIIMQGLYCFLCNYQAPMANLSPIEYDHRILIRKRVFSFIVNRGLESIYHCSLASENLSLMILQDNA